MGEGGRVKKAKYLNTISKSRVGVSLLFLLYFLNRLFLTVFLFTVSKESVVVLHRGSWETFKLLFALSKS